MTIKNEIMEAFDFIVNDYDDYMKKTNHANSQMKIIKLLKDEISGEVIDVGTGTGVIAIDIAKMIPNSKVNAIDISEKMIERAKKNAQMIGVNINFVVDDIEKSRLPDNKFDIVICCLGMLWFVDKEASLKEMTRICKNNGKIILIEEKGETTRSKKPEKIENKNTIFNERLLLFFSKIEKLETPIPLEDIERKMNILGYKMTKTVKENIDENHGFMGMVFEVE